MNESESTILGQYLDRIIADTQAGKMVWVRNNPTTFVWQKTVSQTREAQINLQQIKVMEVLPNQSGVLQAQNVDHYLFQVFDHNTLRLSVNTQEELKHKPKLKRLFQVVSTHLERESLDFLKKIIES